MSQNLSSAAVVIGALRVNDVNFKLFLTVVYEEDNIYFLCPQRNFGRHIVIALSVRPSVRQSVRQSVRPAFVSGPYLQYSLR